MKKTIELHDGVEMPILGLGTFRAQGDDCERVVEFGLKNGYDHVDTAQGYANEKQVGAGWKASGRPREEIFITTKINNSNQGYEKSKQSFKESLKDLQTDYVDLLLIHWPNISEFDLTIDTWRALIDLQAQGLCRSIGVSNFDIPLTEKLLGKIDVMPAINQVEFHTFLYQKELLEYARDKGIQIEAYSPIAKAKLFDNKNLQRIAEKYTRSPAQVMLAWLLNHEVVAIPKSVNEDRIKENADIFFELDDEDLQTLNNLQPQTRLVNGPGTPPSWGN